MLLVWPRRQSSRQVGKRSNNNFAFFATLTIECWKQTHDMSMICDGVASNGEQ